MGSSTGATGTTQNVTTPGPLQVAPQIANYLEGAGQSAYQGLGQFPLAPFSQPTILQVPALTQLQQGGLNLIGDRVANGIQTPYAEQQLYNLFPYSSQVAGTPVGIMPSEQQAMGYAQALPNLAGQQVPVDPIRAQQYGNTQSLQEQVSNPIGLQGQELAAQGLYQGMPGVVGYGTNPYEQLGGASLAQFTGDTVGNTPALESALAQIRNVVMPQVQNQMAKMGLGRSGAAGAELADRMTGTLLPLYMQGQQQQFQAGSQLANLGLQQQGQVLGANQAAAQGLQGIGGTAGARLSDSLQRAMALEPLLQQSATGIAGAREGLNTQALDRLLGATTNATLPTLLGVGGREGSREENTLNRMLTTTTGQYAPLLSLGGTESQRGIEQINEALQGGGLERDVLGQMAQAVYADAMRRQGLAQSFINPVLGATPSLTTFPSVSTTTSSMPQQK